MCVCGYNNASGPACGRTNWRDTQPCQKHANLMHLASNFFITGSHRYWHALVSHNKTSRAMPVGPKMFNPSCNNSHDQSQCDGRKKNAFGERSVYQVFPMFGNLFPPRWIPALQFYMFKRSNHCCMHPCLLKPLVCCMFLERYHPCASRKFTACLNAVI